jgi:hypothetical protein
MKSDIRTATSLNQLTAHHDSDVSRYYPLTFRRVPPRWSAPYKHGSNWSTTVCPKHTRYWTLKTWSIFRQHWTLPPNSAYQIPRQDAINLLAPEFGVQILAHSVYKMRIIQEPKKVALWNKRHF